MPSPQQLRVHLVPQLVEPEALAGSVCLVIDVLRASTTMIHALAAGAREILVYQDVEEARQQAARLPAGSCLLGGERGGRPIAGFDLGNSPAEYSPQRVVDRSLAFTTTNGTRALWHCRFAVRVLVAAAVNRSAVCASVARDDRVDIVCAGTNGQVTREDALVAGAIAAPLTRAGKRTICDQTRLAIAAWEQVVSGCGDEPTAVSQALAEAMRDSSGGRNLLDLGLGADIDAAAQVDARPLVARYFADASRVLVERS